MKILLVAPHFYDYGYMIRSSLLRAGYNVSALDYYQPNRPRGLWHYTKQFIEKLYLSDRWEDWHRERFSASVFKKIEEFRPAILLIIKGNKLTEKFLRSTKKRFKNLTIIAWYMDPMVSIPFSGENLPFYDKIFTFEKDDINHIKNNYNQNVEYLPLAFDPDYYYPQNFGSYDNDIFFCGNVRDFKRFETLEILAEYGVENNLKMRFYGNWWLKNYIRKFELYRKYPKLWKFIHNAGLNHSSINDLYSRSKIALNIHHSHSKKSLNIRTFEAAGAGALQMTDNTFAGEHFKDGEDILIYNRDNLVSKIDNILKNYTDMQVIRDNARRNALSKHTFDIRISKILEKL